MRRPASRFRGRSHVRRTVRSNAARDGGPPNCARSRGSDSSSCCRTWCRPQAPTRNARRIAAASRGARPGRAFRKWNSFGSRSRRGGSPQSFSAHCSTATGSGRKEVGSSCSILLKDVVAKAGIVRIVPPRLPRPCVGY